MFCPACGKNLSYNKGFCMKCGTELPYDQGMPMEKSVPAIHFASDEGFCSESSAVSASSERTDISDLNQNAVAVSHVEASGGLKVWLWIVFGFNALGIISAMGNVFVLSKYIGRVSSGNVVFSIVLSLAIMFASYRMLKGYKDGFYLMCLCAVLSMVLSIISGLAPVTAIILSLIVPVITWILSREQMEFFE